MAGHQLRVDGGGDGLRVVVVRICKRERPILTQWAASVSRLNFLSGTYELRIQIVRQMMCTCYSILGADEKRQRRTVAGGSRRASEMRPRFPVFLTTVPLWLGWVPFKLFKPIYWTLACSAPPSFNRLFRSRLTGGRCASFSQPQGRKISKCVVLSCTP